MPVDVLTEITIERDIDVVSAYAADPSNAPAWYVNIESVEYVTPPPTQVGSKVAFVAKFLGRRLTYTYEFVELVPSERVVMRTAQGPFPMETIYEWSAPRAGTTRMTLRNRGEPAGFSKLMAPFIHGSRYAARQPQGPHPPPIDPRSALRLGESVDGPPLTRRTNFSNF